MNSGQELTVLLREELASLQALHDAMRAERSALEAHDAPRIETCTQQKDTLITHHTEVQARRSAFLAQRAPNASLTDCIASWAEAAENARLQQELIALGASCQDLNRASGLLISRLQERTREALNVLRQAESAPQLYSITGQSDHRTDSQPLGKA